jgi:hypothetical protein
VEQYDERRDEVVKITLSPAMLRDLRAALDLPEGSTRPSRAERRARRGAPPPASLPPGYYEARRSSRARAPWRSKRRDPAVRPR